MKLINNIIAKLKDGNPIEPSEGKVVAMLLEEMMLRDKQEGQLYKVHMSKEMYMRINTTFYTPEGDFKFKTLNI
jgi:hypothetical protein